MNSPRDWTIERFGKDRHPTLPQLEATIDLFRRNLPVFDGQSNASNAEALAMRGTPDHLRGLLDEKTLLLVCGTRESVAGLLEWDPRDRGVMIAFITWIMVDEGRRGQGLSTMLHEEFERACVPELMENTDLDVIQGLAVHLKNPALNIYRKWGYAEDGYPQYGDGRMLFMGKTPVRRR